MLKALDKVVSGYKTYIASTAFVGVNMVAASMGVDLGVYSAAVEGLYGLGVEVLTSIETWYAAVIVILRKARAGGE